MCESCYRNDFLSFDTDEDFEKFKDTLTEKLTSNALQLISKDGMHLDHRIVVYTCHTCQENWWLSLPENGWRGFFIREVHAKSLIKKRSKSIRKRQVVYLTFSLLIVAALIFYYFWK